MGYIINLIAKESLFGYRSETFKTDVALVEDVGDLGRAMKLQEKQGAIGKLYNLIWFIQTSLPCNKLFMDQAETISSAQDELGKKAKKLHFMMITRFDETRLIE